MLWEGWHYFAVFHLSRPGLVPIIHKKWGITVLEMHKNWPWKWPHHPDSQSLGPLAGPLADILSVKVENVTLKGQESTSPGRVCKRSTNKLWNNLISFLFSFWVVNVQIYHVKNFGHKDKGPSGFPDPINEYKKASCLFLVLFLATSRPCWLSRSAWMIGEYNSASCCLRSVYFMDQRERWI